jgi:hypothetical protein
MKSKFAVIHSDVHGSSAIHLVGRKRYFIMFIDKFSRYIWIYFVWHKSDVKMAFQMFCNLVEIRVSARIKKLNTDNRGEYVKKVIIVFLERQGIIHDLSPPDAHETNRLYKAMNHANVVMFRSMSLNCTNMIPPALLTQVCSTAIHIKTRLLHSTFKLKIVPSKIMFSDKPTIKSFGPCRANYYMHIPEQKSIIKSRLSPREILCDIVAYMELSKILRLYDSKTGRGFTSRAVVFPVLQYALSQLRSNYQ